MTGRVLWLSAAPAMASSLAAGKPSGTVAMNSRTACIPSACHSAWSSGSSQQPVARKDTPRRPVRRSSPRTISSQEWNTVAAYGPWASSKNVASTGPVASSRVRKMTRRPDRIGGVWVATLTPATSSSDLLRFESRSLLRVAPSSSRNSAKESTTCRLASRPRISSSAFIRSSASISGSPLTSPSPGSSPRSRVSWTEVTGGGVRVAFDWAAAFAHTPSRAGRPSTKLPGPRRCLAPASAGHCCCVHRPRLP